MRTFNTICICILIGCLYAEIVYADYLWATIDAMLICALSFDMDNYEN